MGLSASKPTEIPRSVCFPPLVESLPSMKGKTVAVTGCTSGMGLVCARVCGQKGARVLMLNRPSDRADSARNRLKEEGIDCVHVPCDLSSFESVKECAKVVRELVGGKGGLDVLCNNAGVMGLPDQATGDGCDIQMQCNHLSHFLLTSELLGVLEEASDQRGEARIVNHSSGARKKPNYPLEAKYLGTHGGELGGNFWPLQKWKRYQQSKLANVLFTYALDNRLQSRNSKVKVMAAHPGATLTDLQMKTAQAGGTGLLDTYILNSTMKSAHSEEDGTCGIIIGCCRPDVKSGEFYGPKGLTGEAILLREERDGPAEQLLWEESIKTTGAKWFA